MRLSVCVPVYNVAEHIEQCARSLFAQTYEDIEYVFVDDCTPDDSIARLRRIMDEYPNRAPQVRIVRHDVNRGLIAARKTALAAATGELVAHCDPDDWVDADFYAKLIRRLEESGADMALGAICGEYADGRRSMRDPGEGAWTGEDAIAGFGRIPALTSMVNKVYRRDLYRRFEIVWPDDIRIGEDVCHMMQLIARCTQVVTVPSTLNPLPSNPQTLKPSHPLTLYHYRIHGVSMTNAAPSNRVVADHIAVFDVLSKTLPRPAGDPCLHYLVRTILYWGMAHGGLSCREFRRWRATYRMLGGAYAFPDRCRTGQRIMAIARVSPLAARCVAIWKRSHILDVL